MIKYFAGAEIPGWRTLLYDSGVRHMAMSYVGLGRRVKHTDNWPIAGKFPDGVDVFLESGAHTLNKNPDAVSGDDLASLVDGYIGFAEMNEKAIVVGTEFDAVLLEPQLRAKNRVRLHEILQDKFLPIWHENTGLPELRRLADEYGRVGVLQAAVGGKDITPVLLSLARAGIRLHGVAMTQIDAMRIIPWDSVASTSWLSPAQYGDTIIWTGRELKRYPRKYAAQARKRHRTHLARNGFDAELIEAGNSTELLRLSIWSWNSYVDHINQQTKKVYLLHQPNRTMPLRRKHYPSQLVNPPLKRGIFRRPTNRQKVTVGHVPGSPRPRCLASNSSTKPSERSTKTASV